MSTSVEPIHSVAFDQVSLSRGFWGTRLEANRSVTVPHVLALCESTGRIRNFIRAVEAEPGPWCSDYPYDDSDVYKCIEGAAHTLRTHPDPDLSSYLDRLIGYIAGAQEADGYLYPFARFDFDRDVQGRSRDWWYGPGRWDKVHLHSHELYNVGHLYEAAVAHFEATGKRSLLNVALKSADLVSRTFGSGPAQRQSIPGHQEIELGLMALFRVTGDLKYLETANFFLTARGDPAYGLEGGAYWQNHVPAKDQREAVGHAVRAAYMYSAMAESDAHAGSHVFTTALEAIWHDIVSKKLYLTGGIGASGDNEGFLGPYELPNDTAYCETCAAIANVLWNQRLFLTTGDAKYADVIERSLFNNVLSGVSLTGDSFFYPNPLESERGSARKTWFGCACCPSNMVRFLPRVPGLAYAIQGRDVFVSQFMSGEASMIAGGTEVRIDQETDYPWSGHVRLTIQPAKPVSLALRIRVPGWAQNRPVPSRLYSYTRPSNEPVSVRINGTGLVPALQNGYVVLDRIWGSGDDVEVRFPMPVQTVRADDRVAANRGLVALERGPLVYALEQPDNSLPVFDIHLEADAAYSADWEPDLLGGVISINGEAHGANPQGTNSQGTFKAVPYFAWANRTLSPMRVWVEEARSVAEE